jgi:hypothetical protein
MVSLKVYDLLGREVATLVNEFQDAGVHQSEFGIENAKGGSGIYFYRLQSAGYSETKKMVGLQ